MTERGGGWSKRELHLLKSCNNLVGEINSLILNHIANVFGHISLSSSDEYESYGFNPCNKMQISKVIIIYYKCQCLL